MTHPFPTKGSAFTCFAPQPAGASAPTGDEGWDTLNSAGNRQFIEMLNGFRSSGGLVRIPLAVRLFRDRGGPDATVWSRWVSSREIIGCQWGSETWVPMFQVDLVTMAPHEDLGTVFAELIPVLDPWGIAMWFARPHIWLLDQCPADSMSTNMRAVWQAARVDRYSLGRWPLDRARVPAA